MSRGLRIQLDANRCPGSVTGDSENGFQENCVMRANAGDIMRAVPIQGPFSHNLGPSRRFVALQWYVAYQSHSGL